ncbi:hypothetical protein F8M41_007509 [Gigaspora margarita]|uniref:Uncharacterized protein n=1 Tax=Gigaspora margarita TaxID=4874 RepID=A0A8H4ERA5_GIGMA|nr:hypothetical protein F8M41_007509 [Gigaspora margarita]
MKKINKLVLLAITSLCLNSILKSPLLNIQDASAECCGRMPKFYKRAYGDSGFCCGMGKCNLSCCKCKGGCDQDCVRARELGYLEVTETIYVTQTQTETVHYPTLITLTETKTVRETKTETEKTENYYPTLITLTETKTVIETKTETQNHYHIHNHPQFHFHINRENGIIHEATYEIEGGKIFEINDGKKSEIKDKREYKKIEQIIKQQTQIKHNEL